MDTNIGYDRYGRAQFAVRATYSITPALAVYGVVAPTWSAEKVDTDTGCPALTVATSNAGCATRTPVNSESFAKGDSSYIGTEITRRHDVAVCAERGAGSGGVLPVRRVCAGHDRAAERRGGEA
jgi:hypothetical protein